MTVNLFARSCGHLPDRTVPQIFIVAVALLGAIIHWVSNGVKSGGIRSAHKKKMKRLQNQGFLLEKTYQKPVVTFESLVRADRNQRRR